MAALDKDADRIDLASAIYEFSELATHHLREAFAAGPREGSLAWSDIRDQRARAREYVMEPLLPVRAPLVAAALDYSRGAALLILESEYAVAALTIVRALLETTTRALWLMDTAVSSQERLRRAANELLYGKSEATVLVAEAERSMDEFLGIPPRDDYYMDVDALDGIDSVREWGLEQGLELVLDKRRASTRRPPAAPYLASDTQQRPRASSSGTIAWAIKTYVPEMPPVLGVSLYRSLSPVAHGVSHMQATLGRDEGAPLAQAFLAPDANEVIFYAEEGARCLLLMCQQALEQLGADPVLGAAASRIWSRLESE